MGCGKWGLEREGQVPRRKAANNRTETVARACVVAQKVGAWKLKTREAQL